MTEAQRKEIREKVEREVNNIGCVLQRKFTIPDLLKIKCHLEDMNQWWHVVAIDEASLDNLWDIAKNVVRLKKQIEENQSEEPYTEVMELFVEISHHHNVAARLLKALVENTPYTVWNRMDLSKAEKETLMFMTKSLKKFEGIPWQVKQALPLVEKIRMHKNADQAIKQLFDTPEWIQKAS